MKIERAKVLKIISEFRFKFGDKNKINDLLVDYGYELNPEKAAANLSSVIEEKYKGVSNGFLASIYEMLMGDEVEVVGDVFELYECPCCSYKTLDEIFDIKKGTGYDICPVCNWEDDGTVDINIRSSVNSGSISDYRLRMKLNENLFYREKWMKK